MKKNAVKNIYKVSIVILVVIMIVLTNVLLSLKIKENKIIYKNLYNSIQLFGLVMEDFNESIIDAQTNTEKYYFIIQTRKRLHYLNESMDYSVINENFDSLMEPLVDYLNGLNDNSLQRDTAYLNDVIEKLDKVYLISRKIANISPRGVYKNGDAVFFDFKLDPRVVDYFNEINSIVAER